MDERISRNLQRLQQLGAPDADIAAYLREEGIAPQSADVGDVAKSFGSGVARGTIGTVGLPADITKLMGAGLSQEAAAGVPVEPMRQQMLGAMPAWLRKYHETPAAPIGSAEMMRAVDSATGMPVTSFQPKSTTGEFAKTVGEFAPGLIGGGGLPGVARRAVTNVMAPGVASEAAGQYTKGSQWEPAARIAGALAGGIAPSIAARAVTPLPTDAARLAAVNTLRNEGVTDLTAGQMTGRQPLKYLEAERGRGANLTQSQAEQFTAATLQRAGINANRATAGVIDDAFTRIGGEFDTLAARNVATVDQQLVQDVGAALGDYNNLVSAPNRTPAVLNFIQELGTAAQANGGQIPGAVYQSLRSRMERAARGMGNNPEAMMALREIRESVDDAMERSLVAAGNQADVAAWQQARNQYRNMLVIERAATAAGADARLGIITPQHLRSATINLQGRRAFARGRGDFAELAGAGEAIMSPLPNSGTAGRISAQNLGAGVLSALGAGGAHAAGGDASTVMLGALAGGTLPRVAGAAVTSAPGRAYLSNQALAPVINTLTPGTSAAVGGALAGRQQLSDVLAKRKRDSFVRTLNDLAERRAARAGR